MTIVTLYVVVVEDINEIQHQLLKAVYQTILFIESLLSLFYKLIRLSSAWQRLGYLSQLMNCSYTQIIIAINCALHISKILEIIKE